MMTVLSKIWLFLIFLCSLFPLPIFSQEFLEITSEITSNQKQPKAGYLEVLDSTVVLLLLTARGSGLLQYVWTRNDSVIKNSTESQMILGITNFNHSGVYRCIVQNSVGSVRSLPFYLTVKELGLFPQNPNQTVSIQEGRYAVLRMPTISYISDSALVDWLVDSYLGTKYVTTSKDLVLLNVQASSSGTKFQVRVTHISSTVTTTNSNFFILSIAPSTSSIPLEFVIKPQNKTARQGDEVKFECVVNGPSFSSIKLSWYLVNGQSSTPLSASDKYLFEEENRLLTIKSLTLADAGTYECNASAPSLPSQAERAILSIIVQPSVSIDPSSSSIKKDFQNPFSLSCLGQGLPSPQITWYFNGRKAEDLNSTGVQVLANGTLSISSVDLPDSGIYQCVAVNSAGESTKSTLLTVNSAPPSILEAPKNATVAEFLDTGFTCKVIGGPLPDVYWTKDGVNLTIGGRIWFTNGQLLIGGSQLTDSGSYKCIAVNTKGSVSASATLTVIIKTQIIKPPQNMSRILGTDALLDCGVRKDPTVVPIWTWFFYKSPDFIKQEINGSRYNIYPNGSLSILGLVGADTGRYECVVQSLGGNDNKSAILKVIDTPSAPLITAVVLNNVIPNSVVINWTLSYDGDTDIIKFTIQSRLESSSGTGSDNPWNTINNAVSPTLRSSIVLNLTPSKYYRFRMTAVNQVGESVPSNPAPAQAIKMPAQPPSESPKNLFCKTGGEQEIIVQWDAPPESSWNGELFGYLIYYKVDAFSDETEKIQNVTTKDARQTTISYLSFNRRYRIRMAAYNEKGPGVNTSDFYVTTLQGKPSSPPLNVVLSSPTSTIIQVLWDPPPSIELNGVNKGYDIEIKQGGILYRSEFVMFDEMNPTGRQAYNITNLLKYTQYDIRLACRTEAGAGPQSPTQSYRTMEDLPGPVSDLKIDNIRDKSLRINWQPPLELNGIITGYRITYRVKTQNQSTVIDRSADTLSHALNDLLYATTYVISVQAKTSIGPGYPRTTEIDSGVPPELPGPPRSLAVTNIEARTVLLQFFPGFDGHTLITLWIVQAQTDASADWVNIYNLSDPTATQILVKNLLPYTKYRLRIIAQNIVDKSEPSEPCIQFQTNQAAPGVPPQDVTPRAISSTAIRVRWRQIPRTEWNGDFLGYRIRYRRWSKDVNPNTTSSADLLLVQQQTWTTVELSNGSSIQEYILSSLEEWMDYQIEMTSYNAVGSSASSPTMSERTEEDVPKTSPANLLLATINSTSIKVSWSALPILEQNGNIRGYKVIYKISSVNAQSETVQLDGSSTLNVTLTNLKKYTEYEIQVLAFTRMGDGARSTALVKRTAEDVPGPPVIIYFPQVSDNSATIVWQAPEEPNGVIIKYKVSYKQRDQPDTVFESNAVEKPNNEFNMTVTGLSRETYYVFAVTARTQNGWGETAKVDVFIIANRDRPDPPTNLRIDSSEILARSVTIIWKAGNDNYGPVRNFTVQYKKKDEDWKTVPQAIKPQLASYTVTGLLPNSLYTFRVAATNDVGTSGYSSASNEIYTLPDKPDGAPQNVKVMAVTQTSIRITWDPPPNSTWNGLPLSDIVQFREEGAVAFREDSIPFGLYTATLQGLIIGLKYEIQIMTANTVGRGPPSTLQVFRVGDVAPAAAPMNVMMFNRSSTTLEITWQLPPAGTTNGELIGYKILYWLSPTGTCEATGSSVQMSVTELRLLVTGLQPYTTYCSTVQAVNIAGEGPKSSVTKIITSEDLPGPPENIKFQNITLRELTVLWSPPKVPNGKITFYTLQYYAVIDDQKTDISTIRIPGTETQQYVNDLLENQTYTFSLSANTSIGRGAAYESKIVPGPQPGSPDAPLKPEVTYKSKVIYFTWQNQKPGLSPIYAYKLYYQEDGESGKWLFFLDVNRPEPSAQISENDLKPNTGYYFSVRAINSVGISRPSPPSELYNTPSYAVISKQAIAPFHTQWWFLVIVALGGVVIILLIITFLCCFEKKRRKQNEMKRSTTSTTVMSATPEPEEGGFPSMELRQSRRSVNRLGNNKTQNGTLTRSPPRPSPASVIYSESIPPMAAGATARKRTASDESSVLSEKPSNIGDSSDEETSLSDSSSIDSIAKAPVPASPPPPAFSSQYSRSTSNNTSIVAGPSTSRNVNKNQNPSWRFQSQQNNAYTYTDSEADSSHYAFSLTNGNIVVNNVAGARTPLSGFSSFV
ncbi:protein sidekick-2-like [Biomphalaria glabrata]|uniref:Protein sidekick-2-like n=1 Tax=Biomphalaria glabrata TaxID=6526 RepID=A0A9U8DVW1_BIOGL|nr:protein sidekick-2-like [Biomphalaria glabrata]XP_055877608.1 protein sidekick-2-like [Biomphalaria glabrata]XP_055877609.1 protein sidekick-2-like [Biomphalaria glabrata]